MAQRKTERAQEKRSEQVERQRERNLERHKIAEKKAAERALEPIPEGRGTMLLMGIITIFLTGFRLAAGKTVGFGDSEALYASYGLFPQAAYLDHPGLIGVLARAIGEGGAPNPSNAHSLTTTLSMFTPWIGFAASRALGSTRRGAALTGIALAVVPEMAVGLFALSPDTLLAPLWLASLAFAFAAMRAKEDSLKSASSFMAAGFLAGVATTAKVSGVCLMVSLAITYALMRRVPGAPSARSRWPWLGLIIGCIVVAPVVNFESMHGWAMFHHRVTDAMSQGPSIATIGTVLGGQVLYISPIFLGLSFIVGRALYRAKWEDAQKLLLAVNMTVSLVVLLVVSMLSHSAEPHWLAPIYLPIAIYVSTIDKLRFGRAGAVLAATMSAFVYAWVLSPELPRLWPKSVDAKGDITNELFGWKQALSAIAETVDQERIAGDQGDVVVVGPHWTVCAQLRAGIPRDVDVGCNEPAKNDFDDWMPKDNWQKRGTIIYVTTEKFAVDADKILPEYNVDADHRLSVFRAGKMARIFHIIVLKRRAKA